MNRTSNNSVYEFSFNFNCCIFNGLFYEDETIDGNIFVVHHISTTDNFNDFPIGIQILASKIKEDLSNGIFFSEYPDDFFGQVCLGIFNRLKNIKEI